jgi:hypothetical protein
MVCYVYECNYVRVIPMKSRSASEWVKAYDSIHQELTVKGVKPKLQTLDNEASAALKNFSPPMTWSTNWYLPIATVAMSLNAPFGLSKNTLWQGSVSRPRLSIALVGQTLNAGGNHIESLVDLETPSTIIRRSALSWPRGLQKNGFLSARMQNHCTRETRKTTHLGAPRTIWIFLGPSNASLPVSKCLHLRHG